MKSMHPITETAALDQKRREVPDAVAHPAARGVQAPRVGGAVAAQDLGEAVSATNLRTRLVVMAGDALALRGEQWLHVTEDGTLGSVHVVAPGESYGRIIAQAQARLGDADHRVRQSTARHVANMDPATAVALIDAASVLVDIVCDKRPISTGKPEIAQLLRALQVTT